MTHVMIWLIIVILMSVSIFSLNLTAEPADWSEDTNLTLDDDKDSQKPSIGIFKDNIYVVWTDQRHYPITNAPEIYYKNSTDGGRTWNSEVRLTFIESSKNYLGMASDGNNIHIVWHDSREGGGNKIFYKNSTDGGNTWSADRRISQSFGEEADIGVNGSNIHIVYYYNWQIYYINSTDSGITWSEPQILTGVTRDSFAPSIAVNGSNVHIVWTDHYDKFGNPTMGAIFYLNSSDGGLTWSEDFNLTPMNLDADYPDIAADGDNIHITYCEEQSGLWQIYYRRSEDNGLTWSGEFMLSNSPEDLSLNVIKVKENAVYTSWSDPKNPVTEIYFRNSSDNGQNWFDEIRMTYDPAHSWDPDIGIGDKTLHLVWHDKRDGAKEIYYKRYPYYNPPTNLTVDIWETNLTLNWTTPQTGLSLVDYYLIYRVTDPETFTFSDPEIIYNSSGTGNDLLTTWNDTTALLDGTNNYYYVVRAVYENGEIDYNENIVGKFIIPLKAGWNLISLPLAQDNSSVSEVLKSIDGNYDVIWIYDAKEARWRSSTSDLIDINRTMGLWVHMKNACNLSVVGAVPESTDIALYEGWNLAGYPSLKTRSLNDALSGITWQAVQYYDAFDAYDPWKHNSTNKPDNLNDLKEMKSGRGYWIYITINDTWIRTRTIEDNKIVIWRVGESEEKVLLNNQPIHELTSENSIEMEDEDDYKMDNVIEEEPIIRNNENNLVHSLVPLIILITIIFVEIKIFNKKRK